MNDTGYPLANRVFMCGLPQLASMDEIDLSIYGILQTGDAIIDERIRNSTIDVYCTINELVEYQKRGVGFSIYKREDCEIIYNLIQEHLEYWNTMLQYSPNVGNAPTEYLIELDKLAHLVFPVANARTIARIPGSSLNRLFSGISLMDTKGINFIDTSEEQIPLQEQEYNSLESTFADAARNNGFISGYNANNVNPNKWRVK